VSRTVVDVEEFTHTCGPDATPHVYATRRTIVEHTPAGPCLAPVTVHAGRRAVVLPCGRVRPSVAQCNACRPVVVVWHTTTTHTGHEPGPTGHIPAGWAGQPCTVCGAPLPAALANLGRHLLCGVPLPERQYWL
jgi:hypothetical protein